MHIPSLYPFLLIPTHSYSFPLSLSRERAGKEEEGGKNAWGREEGKTKRGESSLLEAWSMRPNWNTINLTFALNLEPFCRNLFCWKKVCRILF